MMATMETTHHPLSAGGISASPLCLCHCPCCYCDTVTPPPSAPHCAPDLPLILETPQARPRPDGPPPRSLNGSQCSHFDSSPHPALLPQPRVMFPHSPLCLLLQLELQVLRGFWGLRGLRGCSCPRNRAQSWDWSAGKERGCLVLWSWCMEPHRVPGQIPRTSPLDQQHPGSAVERMNIKTLG